MSHTPNSAPSATPRDREARSRALMDRLRPASERALPQMAEGLVDAPGHELFRAAELRPRDCAHDLAAAAHQAGLASRKKGGTAAPVSPARGA